MPPPAALKPPTPEPDTSTRALSASEQTAEAGSQVGLPPDKDLGKLSRFNALAKRLGPDNVDPMGESKLLLTGSDENKLFLMWRNDHELVVERSGSAAKVLLAASDLHETLSGAFESTERDAEAITRAASDKFTPKLRVRAVRRRLRSDLFQVGVLQEQVTSMFDSVHYEWAELDEEVLEAAIAWLDLFKYPR